jgi:DNA processing protein
MTNQERGLASWLQLALTPGLGAALLRRLLGEFGLPENVLGAKRAQLERHLPTALIANLQSVDVARAVDQALAWAQLPDHTIVTFADPGYPKLLLEIADPPALLYCSGRAELLSRPSLAVVGSRNATAQGIRNAEQFARTLSDAGITIVSGLAMGIDAAAHRGGLGGDGSTLAVLGTGIDRIYPPQNRALAASIAAQGLLVSELPLATPALRQNFPRRNRLISGLTHGCLVVEAALASGSLITARAAADQGREVFAIPGSIHSPLSKGCHTLIKSGAKLVETAEDVLSELAAFRPGIAAVRAATPHPAPPPAAAESSLLSHLGFDPVDVDVLCARSGLSAAQVAAELLQLELDGHVAALPGGRYQRQS